MSVVVTTDQPHLPCRRLKKRFDNAGGKGTTKAIGTGAPNTLNSNLPTGADAMGLTPESGLLHFMHDGASQVFTIYYWSNRRNAKDASKGWIAGGEGSAINTKTVDPESNASFKCPSKVPYFIKAGTSAVDNCWVHDGGTSDTNNDNTDITDA
jgi:hypothetical protein